MKECRLTVFMVIVSLSLHASVSARQSDNVVLTIKRKIPYCGGAAPSREQANKSELELKCDFVIQYQQGFGDSLWRKVCTTDSFGKISCNLPKGKYCLKRAAKIIIFEDFYQIFKKQDDAYNVYGDRDCYYNWWNSCEFEFEISNEITSIDTEVVIMSYCYTGEDPCHRYTGPHPP